MATINELRRKSVELAKRMQEISRKEADLPTDESLSDEEKSEYDSIKEELAVLSERLDRALEAEQAVAASAEDDSNDGEADEKTVHSYQIVAKGANAQRRSVPATAADAKPKLEPGLLVSRYIHGKSYAGKHGKQAAQEMLSSTYGDNFTAKALGFSVEGGGAEAIPQAFSADYIELLRNAVVVRAASPTVMSMDEGNYTIPRLTGSAESSWGTENTAITESEETLDQVKLEAKILRTLVKTSNQLLRRSPVGMDSLIRDDIVAQAARAEDIAFLAGATGGNNPVGMLNFTGIPTKPVAAGTSLDNVASFMRGLKTVAQRGNSRLLRPAIFMNPEAAAFVATRRDGVGGYPFASIDNDGSIYGVKVYTTNHIPMNLEDVVTDGTNGTRIYFVDMADIVLGQTFNIQVETSEHAGFANDQTWFRLIYEVALGCRHPESVVIGLADSWKLV